MIVELAKGKKTINDLAKQSGVNWKTTQKHLVYLVGTGLANEVFNSEYVRIFEVTPKGREYVAEISGHRYREQDLQNEQTVLS